MYQYTVTQWIFIFYFYCFFGWCFESGYVSLKKHKPTNRGFMRGPFLPLYGSGAIMMLVVSMPFQDNLILTYIAGCFGATALEYVTGVMMEELFKVRYWDYSDERFQFQGHICLKSSLAWGGLTILMTAVIHRPVERFVLAVPAQFLFAVTILLSGWIMIDFALSFKAAMDLRNVLVRLERAKAELGKWQKRMDVLIALTGEEAEQRLTEYKAGWKQKRDEAAQIFADLMEDFEFAAEFADPKMIRDKLLDKISERQREWQQKRRELAENTKLRFQKIFLGNPSLYSQSYEESLQELKNSCEDKKETQP
ncbi:MAG: hypothetical protein J5898_00745 [Lachnospiraceae bacterium]|nr:hypothetical protein [Lachnospiraceae bacterium]